MKDFVSKLVTLNQDEFFDKVSSARTLEGLLTNFNKQVERHAFSNLASVDLDSQNLIMAFGCTKEQINNLLEKPVKTDQIELSIGNNWLETFFPYHNTRDLLQFMTEFKEKTNGGYRDLINKLGIGYVEGFIEVVSDADTLDLLKGDYLPTGFTEIKSDIDEYDDLKLVKLRRYLYRQYMFIKLSGPNNSTDHAIIPFEIKSTFSLGLDNGVGHIYGAMPDIAFK